MVAALVLAVLVSSPSTQVPLVSGKHPARRIESVGPEVVEVSLPAFRGAHAIWGATGQDASGRLWFGVSAANTPVPSAHLVEYDPESALMTDRGNVVDELKRAGVLRDGERQAKIHSRIVQGPEGYLYFASMDEEGEEDNGSRLPTWGGHLWRLQLATHRWEHLLVAPEALIAVAAGGRFVYALGYFGHVLYQYDTKTAVIKQVRVGSVDGHVSRNFIVDYRGHAYVPRLRTAATSTDRRSVTASMVEFSTDLREIRETPLVYDHYVHADNPTASHGVVSIQEMADRSWFFNTHVGFLYHIVPPPAGTGEENDAAAEVQSVSWFHPDGRMYVPSLFTLDGTTTLLGLSIDNLVEGGQSGVQWLTYDLTTATCRVAPFAVHAKDGSMVTRGLFYGSSTRDVRGDHYVVGSVPTDAGDTRPIVLRVRPRVR
ncbi:MAG: hypothetical protein JWL71_106 [Acidobacteria bacterium]|nr:hypothetical protein [Acidobacteriota bacterium]